LATERMGGPCPYCIGLTGNIATGKTTVGRMLAMLGAELIDADRVAHRVMAPDGAAYEGVVRTFGPHILASDGTIDRRKLGALVFADPAALRRLEELVHPAVTALIRAQIYRSPAPVVVIEAIKLLESDLAPLCDEIWVTTCPEELQLERLMTTRGLSREEAELRIRAQPSQEEKLAVADVVIDTSGTLEETRRQVLRAWEVLRAKLQDVSEKGLPIYPQVAQSPCDLHETGRDNA